MLPIYDALFQQDKVKHVLVRHEQGAVHAAEGYARSSGKVGVVLVTSGPGATNAVTGLDRRHDGFHADRLLTGQVPTHLIGSDAFQECDTVGITRPLHQAQLPGEDRSTTCRASCTRPSTSPRTAGPARSWSTCRRTSSSRAGLHARPNNRHKTYRPRSRATSDKIRAAVELMANGQAAGLLHRRRVINSGPRAARLLRELVRLTGFPITSTLMGLGAFPASDPQFLGMLGMHGTYEANLAMHDCDVMINLGARFDDRITGRLDAFSPYSRKIHVDIDASSINKNVKVDVADRRRLRAVLDDMLAVCGGTRPQIDKSGARSWWGKIGGWRARNCLAYRPSGEMIKPQHAVAAPLRADQGPRHLHHDRGRPAPDVGGAVLQVRGAEPLDDVRRPRHHGLRPAGGDRRAARPPEALVVDIAGEASILMNMQEMSTAMQYRLPVKMFILNNEYMGMVRQWQELLHGGRYSQSYSDSLPDFVKLAEAYRRRGHPLRRPGDLDAAIREMIAVDRPGDLRLRRRQEGELLPDDPVGQGPQRDDPQRLSRRDRRGLAR